MSNEELLAQVSSLIKDHNSNMVDYIETVRKEANASEMNQREHFTKICSEVGEHAKSLNETFNLHVKEIQEKLTAYDKLNHDRNDSSIKSNRLIALSMIYAKYDMSPVAAMRQLTELENQL